VRVAVRKAIAGRDALVTEAGLLELERLSRHAELQVRRAVEPGPEVLQVRLEVPERERHWRNPTVQQAPLPMQSGSALPQEPPPFAAPGGRSDAAAARCRRFSPIACADGAGRSRRRPRRPRPAPSSPPPPAPLRRRRPPRPAGWRAAAAPIPRRSPRAI